MTIYSRWNCLHSSLKRIVLKGQMVGSLTVEQYRMQAYQKKMYKFRFFDGWLKNRINLFKTDHYV